MSHESEVQAINEEQRCEPVEVFEPLKERVKSLVGQGKKPIIIVSMDGALLDNRPRMLKVIADELTGGLAQKLDEKTLRAIASITPRRMSDDIEETLREHGVDDEELLATFRRAYDEKFDTNDYVLFDLPLPGAVPFLKTLSDAEGFIAYFANRNTARSRAGTERSLSMFEFPPPRGETGTLFTQDEGGSDALALKRSGGEELKGQGEVVAVFDNDPKALAIFGELLPDAELVMVDNAIPSSTADLPSRAKVLKHYRLPSAE